MREEKLVLMIVGSLVSVALTLLAAVSMVPQARLVDVLTLFAGGFTS